MMMIQTFFFQLGSSIILNFQGKFIIMAGDFNIIRNVYLVYFYHTNVNNKRARKKVLNIKVVHSLTDPWRVK